MRAWTARRRSQPPRCRRTHQSSTRPSAPSSRPRLPLARELPRSRLLRAHRSPASQRRRKRATRRGASPHPIRRRCPILPWSAGPARVSVRPPGRSLTREPRSPHHRVRPAVRLRLRPRQGAVSLPRRRRRPRRRCRCGCRCLCGSPPENRPVRQRPSPRRPRGRSRAWARGFRAPRGGSAAPPRRLRRAATLPVGSLAYPSLASEPTSSKPGGRRSSRSLSGCRSR
jgi:hypothetical protein